MYVCICNQITEDMLQKNPNLINKLATNCGSCENTKTNMKKKLREKIEDRMVILEQMMSRNMHLTDPDTVEFLLDRITYCWSILNEEDRDYIHGVRFAIEEKHEWSL